ncbi:MAG: OsmC family peroxiredoxin, partial [Gammaproteobacteria bacterium]
GNRAIAYMGPRKLEIQNLDYPKLIGPGGRKCDLALSLELGNAGMTAESIRTTATVTIEKSDPGFAITAVHLDVLAKIPGANRQAFETAANQAKTGCPVSKVLNANITI